MQGEEIVRQIAAQRREDHHFISWWRREEDWLDFELLNTFLENVKPDEEIGGFTLLGMDEMWERVSKLAGNRVAKGHNGAGDVITWKRPSGREMTCPFTPETLIRIIDVESQGNFVDG